MKKKDKKGSDTTAEKKETDCGCENAKDCENSCAEGADGVDSAENTAGNPADTVADDSATEVEQDDQVKVLNERNLRLMAEFENFKRRTAKEKEDMFAYAKISCISDFLTVIDNFERALAVETTDESYKKGMQMIFNQYLDILTKQGVTEIKAEGEPFDPNLHHAVSQIEDENAPPNSVHQVFQKGYMLGERVLRHAMVVVAN